MIEQRPWAWKRINKICPICGKFFVVPKCHDFVKTCSKSCGYKYKRQFTKNLKWGIREKRTCLYCKCEYETLKSSKKNIKFCSRSCSLKYKSKNAKHPDEKLLQRRKWHKRNSERINRQCRKQYKENPEKSINCAIKWQKENPERKLENNRQYYKKKRQDPKFKLNDIIRKGILKSLNGNKNGKHWEDIVGYTLDKLINHLESLFEDDMSWNNHGKWHIDHKTPISVFNFTKPEHRDFKRCWALKNLQPLWAKDNLNKHTKLDGHFQPSLLM